MKAIWAVFVRVLPEWEQPCGKFTEENPPGWRPSPYSSPHFQARTAKPPRRGMHSPPMPGKQASVCRYGAELADRTRRRWVHSV